MALIDQTPVGSLSRSLPRILEQPKKRLPLEAPSQILHRAQGKLGLLDLGILGSALQLGEAQPCCVSVLWFEELGSTLQSFWLIQLLPFLGEACTVKVCH